VIYGVFVSLSSPPPPQQYEVSQDKCNLHINCVFPPLLINCFDIFETISIQFFTSTWDSGVWTGKS